MYGSGLLRAMLTVRPTCGVCVLCYHGVRAHETPPDGLVFSGLHVPADRLDGELAAMRRLGTPVSAGDLLRILAGDMAAPPRAVHVTFDDGYRSIVTRALPLLERHDVPASVFVCTRPIARRELLWYDAVARERGEAEVERLRRGPGRDWPKVLEGLNRPAAEGDELAPMTPDDVAALAAHPLIEIGGHSSSHPRLAALDPESQLAEIRGCLDTIAEWTGRPPVSFAYPTGRRGQDYDETTVAAVQSAGAVCAFTTNPGWARCDVPAFEQPRYVVADGVDGVELAFRFAWAWSD
jgi:peptidoglycan/xylan/chitin deacetylase (PgdA/CDA1 family)